MGHLQSWEPWESSTLVAVEAAQPGVLDRRTETDADGDEDDDADDDADEADAVKEEPARPHGDDDTSCNRTLAS